MGQAHKPCTVMGAASGAKARTAPRGSGKRWRKIPRQICWANWRSLSTAARCGFIAGFRAGTAAQQQGKASAAASTAAWMSRFMGIPLGQKYRNKSFTAQRIYSIHRILYHRFGEMNSLTFEEKHGKLDTDKTRGNNKICPFDDREKLTMADELTPRNASGKYSRIF